MALKAHTQLELDLAMLVRRFLARGPTDGLSHQAYKFLEKNKLLGNVMRGLIE